MQPSGGWPSAVRGRRNAGHTRAAETRLTFGSFVSSMAASSSSSSPSCVSELRQALPGCKAPSAAAQAHLLHVFFFKLVVLVLVVVILLLLPCVPQLFALLSSRLLGPRSLGVTHGRARASSCTSANDQRPPRKEESEGAALCRARHGGSVRRTSSPRPVAGNVCSSVVPHQAILQKRESWADHEAQCAGRLQHIYVDAERPTSTLAAPQRGRRPGVTVTSAASGWTRPASRRRFPAG